MLITGGQQVEIRGRAHVDLAHENSVPEGRQCIGPGHRRCRCHHGAGRLHRLVRGHRNITALRVPGDEQLAAIAGARRRVGTARRGQRIDHVLRLLVAIQIRMIGQRGGVISGVVGGDDDVPLRGEYRRHQQRLTVAGQSRHVEGLRGIRAMGVQHQRTGSLTRSGTSGRNHERPGGFSRLTGPADRLILHVVDVHCTGWRKGEL